MNVLEQEASPSVNDLGAMSESSPGILFHDDGAKFPYWMSFTKRAIDIVFSSAFLILFSWVYLILSIGILFSSGRPIIYSQQRYGKGGRKFNFYKFRSMQSNSGELLEIYLKENPGAKQQWENFQKLDRDPRITGFGAFIRKTSLDELPQFWNVLRGDMSIVGPRPCMLSQKNLYGHRWKHYCAVRPGITGLWQVSGRNKLSFRKRVALDARYVKNLSVKLDTTIFIKTIAVVISGHGSR